MNPVVKMNMKYKKYQLVLMAKDRNISYKGKNKLKLAEEIAKYDIDKFSKNWSIISG